MVKASRLNMVSPGTPTSRSGRLPANASVLSFSSPAGPVSMISALISVGVVMDSNGVLDRFANRGFTAIRSGTRITLGDESGVIVLTDRGLLGMVMSVAVGVALGVVVGVALGVVVGGTLGVVVGVALGVVVGVTVQVTVGVGLAARLAVAVDPLLDVSVI